MTHVAAVLPDRSDQHLAQRHLPFAGRVVAMTASSSMCKAAHNRLTTPPSPIIIYWGVPVTEIVPETHLCPEYQPRIAGTGYRG